MALSDNHSFTLARDPLLYLSNASSALGERGRNNAFGQHPRHLDAERLGSALVVNRTSGGACCRSELG